MNKEVNMFECYKAKINYLNRRVDKYYLAVNKKNIPYIRELLEELNVKYIKNIDNREIEIVANNYKKTRIKEGTIFVISTKKNTMEYLYFDIYKLRYFFENFKKVGK